MNFIKCVIRYVEIYQRSQLVELQFIASARPVGNVKFFHALNLINMDLS